MAMGASHIHLLIDSVAIQVATSEALKHNFVWKTLMYMHIWTYSLPNAPYPLHIWIVIITTSGGFLKGPLIVAAADICL